MTQETEFDGLLYLGDNAPPPPPSAARTAEGEWWGTGVLHHFEELRNAETVLYERALLKTKDPTTLPHVRKKCVKKVHYPGGWTCIGWKIEYQWFYVMATLRVTTKAPVDIKSAVEECLKQGAIAAAIAAILTGGSGAAAAAAAAIKSCLVIKLGENLLNVSVDLSHEWGKWE